MRLEEAVRDWRSAEERLYPVVMVRPDLYTKSIQLVRAVADRLREERTPADLLAAYGRAAQLVAEVVETSGLPAEELDLALVAGAAFSLRHRELVSESQRAEAIRRIQQAKERGERWAVIYETDPGMLPMPYRRLEMHLPSGAGLHAFVEEDPATSGPLYGVEAVQLDPATGDWEADAAPLAERRTFGSPGEWQQAIEDLREHLDQG